MSLSQTRNAVKQHIIEVARRDPRVVGIVDYGSASEGRGDEWSDLDLALFVRDVELPHFEANWKEWAAQFGDLLVAYVGGVGHPWAVYAAEPLPLRVDFAFKPESAVDEAAIWPCAPLSVEAMVAYDDTGGSLSANVAQIVGQSLAPSDRHATFDQVCGDFWYYLLRTHTQLLRGRLWAARHDFNFVIVGNLLALLRLEAGAVEHWQGSSAAVGIEQALSPERLTRLEACIPGPGIDELHRVLSDAALLSHEVCASIATQHRWDWPHRLSQRVRAVLAVSPSDFGQRESLRP